MPDDSTTPPAVPGGAPASPADASPPGGLPPNAAASAPARKGFDIYGALGAGYSADEVAHYLAANPDQSPRFNVKGALDAGYSGQDVLNHLVQGPLQPPPLSDGVMADTAAKIQKSIAAGYSPEEITTYMASNTAAPIAGRIKASLALGYTPAEIVDHLNGTSGGVLQGAPIIAPIARGAAHAMEGVADLATDVGLTGVGSAIRGRINQQDLQAPQAGSAVVSDLQAGKVGAALTNLPSAALEQAPMIGATLAGSALTGGLADAAALPAWLARLVTPATTRAATAAVLSGATQGDAVARARAAANGDATPSASDLALGVLGAAGTGAVGSVGLGGAGAGLAGAVRNVAAHAAADAAAPEMQALAGSVGTSQGAQGATPADMAASALTGAAARGMMEAPAAGQALASASLARLSPVARNATLRAQYAALTDPGQDAARSTAAAGQALQSAMRPGVGGATLSPQDAARAASADLSNGVLRLLGQLGQEGVISGPDGKVVGDALRAAQSPSDVLTADHLAAVSGLELDPATTAALTGGLRTIDNLSQATKAPAPGPIQSVLQEAAGPVAGAMFGGVEGGVPGAITGALVGRVARPAIEGVLGGALGGIGAKLDTLLGTAKPSLVLQARHAAAMLDAAGQPIPDTKADLLAAIAGSRDAVQQQRAILGLPPSAGAGAGPAPGATSNATGAVPSSGQAAPATSGAPPAASETAMPPGGGPAFDAMAAQQAADFARPATAAVTTAPPQGNIVEPGTAPTGAGLPGGASGAPSGLPTGYSATGVPGGLTPAAALQAQRLSPHVYALGAALQSALAASGQARPVNMAGEVGDALGRLVSKGMLPQDVAGALGSHQGRVVPLVYNLIRNEMLTHNGIERRVAAAQAGSEGVAGGNVVPFPAAGQ